MKMTMNERKTIDFSTYEIHRAAHLLNLERQQIKRDRKAQREVDLAARQKSLPGKRYGVILADPERRFKSHSREAGMYFSELENIKSCNIASVAAPDCVLFLWATVPMLPQALSVMEAWEFVYKSHFVWAKDVISTGYWNRNKHELLLIGTKGKIPSPVSGEQFASVIQSPVTKHHEKPPEFYGIIETYFPNLPKIELNARKKRENWDNWYLDFTII